MTIEAHPADEIVNGQHRVCKYAMGPKWLGMAFPAVENNSIVTAVMGSRSLRTANKITGRLWKGWR